MKMNFIIALVLLGVGITLLIMGLNATDTFGERVTETFTGHYSDQTTWYIVGGIAGIIAGAATGAVGLWKPSK